MSTTSSPGTCSPTATTSSWTSQSRRARGSFDARRGRAVLDFFTNFASCPIGYNHPRLDNPEFRDRIATAAINKPANSDIYTTYMAEFVETFARLAVPASLNKHMFFIEGGALGIENAVKTAIDWKVRKNLRKGRPSSAARRSCICARPFTAAPATRFR